MVKCVIAKAGGAKQDSEALSNTLRADVMAESVGSIETSHLHRTSITYLSPGKAPQG